MAVLWGIPYLFIKQAVDSYSPAAVVAGRTLIGALLLLPFALRQKALRPAFGKIGWVLAFGAVEMAGPFLLLGHAEQTLPSGLDRAARGDRAAVRRADRLRRGRPLACCGRRARSGCVVGFVGVVIIVAGPGLAVGRRRACSRWARCCWWRCCTRSRRSSSPAS